MIIALNNKSNLEKEEFESYIKGLESINTEETIILCPTYLNIGAANTSLKIGSQNVSKNENGAYTGEISATQLKSYNVQYAIVGHSERREYQRETNEEINLKIKQLLINDITPILCIGESLKERENNQVKEVLKEELSIAIKDIKEDDKKKIIIAYESKILYGGSANEENIDQLKQIGTIDGYLLGGLSLKLEKLKIFLQKLH